MRVWKPPYDRRLPLEAAQRFKRRAAIHSFASYATVSSASRSFRPNEVPLLHLPDRSLYDLLKVVEKNGPFLLVFSQIVALTIPRRSVVAGLLLVVAILFPPWFEMKLALSRERECQSCWRDRCASEVLAGRPVLGTTNLTACGCKSVDVPNGIGGLL